MALHILNRFWICHYGSKHFTFLSCLSISKITLNHEEAKSISHLILFCHVTWPFLSFPPSNCLRLEKKEKQMYNVKRQAEQKGDHGVLQYRTFEKRSIKLIPSSNDFQLKKVLFQIDKIFIEIYISTYKCVGCGDFSQYEQSLKSLKKMSIKLILLIPI